ncbi:PAP2 superfamily [Phytophthora infestans]|uniref:PAP2 superfamily n=1 Tax=Phytophthora infestans TaxID=4787 RepID=A0A833WGM8_PHYIN|nr:PAP2 superfamily [Phytophthora infestans]KAF4149739.1 PAP2 superfamily [Phytophthora infestans]
MANTDRGDLRLDADDYQSVYTPSLDGKHTSDVTTDTTEARPSAKRWQKYLRDYRVIEYAFAIVLYVIARRLGKWMKMHKRAFPRIEMRLNSTTSIWGRDPAMDQEKLSEQVPMYMLIIISLAIAIAINVSINYVLPMFIKIRVTTHDFRDFLLSLGQAITLSTFLVNFTKNMTGRFLAAQVRKSFPSGHSSFAWSAMGVLTLYLLGRARLTSAEQSRSILQEGVRTFKLFRFLPCLGAAWVAITRSTDNRHHYSDIVAGSVVGAAAACLAYNHNYGSIYSWEMAGLPWETIHERRKAKSDDVLIEEGAANSAQHVVGNPDSG